MNEQSYTDKVLDKLENSGGMNIGLAKSVIPFITTYGNIIIYIMCYLLMLGFTVSVILNIIYVLAPTFRGWVDTKIEDDRGISRNLLSISCKAGREACERAYVRNGKTAVYELVFLEIVAAIKVGLVVGIIIVGSDVLVGLIEKMVEPLIHGGEVLTNG